MDCELDLPRLDDVRRRDDDGGDTRSDRSSDEGLEEDDPTQHGHRLVDAQHQLARVVEDPLERGVRHVPSEDGSEAYPEETRGGGGGKGGGKGGGRDAHRVLEEG